jgi:hypothetical protein
MFNVGTNPLLMRSVSDAISSGSGVTSSSCGKAGRWQLSPRLTVSQGIFLFSLGLRPMYLTYSFTICI